MKRLLLVFDPIAIVLFAAIGRDAHRETSSEAVLTAETYGIGDVLETAAPFLIGVLVGWLVMQAWRRPTHLMVGAGVAASTVVVGMLVRSFAFDGGTPPSFVVVATLFLAAALLGWRVVAMRLQAGG